MSKLMIPAAVAAALLLAACERHDPNSPSTATPLGTPPASPKVAQTATPAPPVPATTAPAAQADPTSAMGAAAASAGDKGAQVFAQTCVVCHGAGVAGAPRVGDKADWAPRLQQGKDALYRHALQGFSGKKGTMPPKGGNNALADADVKSAVDYMVSQAK